MSPGLYIHVPFCTSKCLYCDFYSVRFDPEVNREYVRALRREIAVRRRRTFGRCPDTVFFGGGTPSLLSPVDVTDILNTVHEACRLDPSVEITMECNPGTLTKAHLQGLRDAGVNRISLGIQSLVPQDLITLGRTHTADDGVNAFRMARDTGFRNISVDLIFGVPGQGLAAWEKTLRGILDLEPEHVSVYELTLDGPTPLRRAVESGSLQLLPEGLLEEMYLRAGSLLEGAGLRQYEISNFARPGVECRHNLNCWTYGEYLGVGPSAHSFVGERRSWNIADVSGYVESVARTGLGEEGFEILSRSDQSFERTMLALRMRQGIVRGSIPQGMATALEELLGAGFLEEHEGRIRLTAKGMLVSNEVFIRLR